MDNLTFDEYAKNAASTTAEFEHANEPWYVVLGLCGESGEVSDGLKKLYREFGSLENAPAERKQHLLKELGDVLWYLVFFLLLLQAEYLVLGLFRRTKERVSGTLSFAPEVAAR